MPLLLFFFLVFSFDFVGIYWHHHIHWFLSCAELLNARGCSNSSFQLYMPLLCFLLIVSIAFAGDILTIIIFVQNLRDFLQLLTARVIWQLLILTVYICYYACLLFCALPALIYWYYYIISITELYSAVDCLRWFDSSWFRLYCPMVLCFYHVVINAFAWIYWCTYICIICS